MPLFKDLKLLQDELQRLEQEQPGNWLGRWAKSIMLKSLKSKITAVEDKLSRRKKRR